ncbi:phosphoadenylyl-sulfate reductase [Cognatishimia activa]|uniref:Phosphoadenosine 5'-phosphosulfate reductase n=1 Tax=Cognatishimia activa TaxID=1715691 RepID=A0A0P1IT03_9RHOB|nr:phosphoadenylyl-sulfate reductase [Cognatishimia activa]CUI74700.1 Phosphoadenosine phosphosulfate reductase [Cognatishimia activa]CUK26685.1 Phosphoadenosine phosphosulfate reductase [Cognatishimia activa]
MNVAVQTKPQSEVAATGPKVFTAANTWLEEQTADTRIAWALENLPRDHVISSSFGIQSAVMLHLMTMHVPDIPVLLFDTGYLFPETYRFVDELKERLNLNLQVYRSDMSPAWQEARFGQLWEQGDEGLKKYNNMNKVEPMQRAMSQVGAGTWYSGLRRAQAESRSERKILEFQHGRVKFHPIVDWHNRDVHRYLKDHDLPYHPLWEQGYVSVGDTHTTRKLEDGMREEDTRFFGMNRECGLHVDQD